MSTVDAQVQAMAPPSMLRAAWSLFAMQKISFLDVAFPRWHSLLVLALISILITLEPNMRSVLFSLGMIAYTVTVAITFVVHWAAFVVMARMLGWWARLRKHWDGKGDMFNLVVAAWAIASLFGTAWTALGTPIDITFGPWFYSMAVTAMALWRVMPTMSLFYSAMGVLLIVIPVILVSLVAYMTLGILVDAFLPMTGLTG